MVGLNATGDLDAVAGQLERITEIDYLVITTGRFDLLAEVVTTSAEHLLVTIGQMRAIEGVTTTEVFGYLRLEKQSYDWGTR
jgi:Lrp/AsnC family transcriptional regulator for asnA, asnC and gidA